MDVITVNVKRKHIKAGKACDCFRCAVALAMQEATGDTEAQIYESTEGCMRLSLWGRSIVAPREVRQFVIDFDDLKRKRSGRVKNPAEVEPFSFDLPPITDEEWDEQCYHCEKYFKPDELSNECICTDCLTKSGNDLR